MMLLSAELIEIISTLCGLDMIGVEGQTELRIISSKLVGNSHHLLDKRFKLTTNLSPSPNSENKAGLTGV